MSPKPRPEPYGGFPTPAETQLSLSTCITFPPSSMGSQIPFQPMTSKPGYFWRKNYSNGEHSQTLSCRALGVLLTFWIQIVQCPHVIEKRAGAHFPTVMEPVAAKSQVFQTAGSCSCCCIKNFICWTCLQFLKYVLKYVLLVNPHDNNIDFPLTLIFRKFHLNIVHHSTVIICDCNLPIQPQKSILES